VSSVLTEPFEALVRHTYDGFYSHPRDDARLGSSWPVQPRGHRIEPAALPISRAWPAGFHLTVEL